MDEYKSAVRVLYDVIEKGRSLDASFTDKDSPLAKQICYGVLRRYYELNLVVASLVNKPLARKHADIHLLLLAGIYSIAALNRPDHASVNATVNTTKALKKAWAKQLVNGVLRNYQRRRDSLQSNIDTDLEASTNHPAWLANRILSAYPNQANAIFAANNEQPPMTLRVNLSRTTRAAYLEQLTRNDISAEPGDFAPTAIYLTSPTAVSNLPGFSEGLVSVQDEASQLTAGIMNLQAGQRVLDACSAPGGKACAMLEVAPDIVLTAIDISPERTLQVEENLTRLGLEATVVAIDFLDYDAPTFDRILLDVPCSATGIIRRHPDIKLLRLDEDIDKLSTTQDNLLAKAWSLLSENGELVYSTCSILPEENEQVVHRFLSKHKDAERYPIEAKFGIPTASGRQLLPDSHAPDGFFFARLKKLPL